MDEPTGHSALKRRSMRCSLLGLFLLMSVIATGLGLLVKTVHDRRRMRARIEARGGMFREFEGGGFVMVRESDPSRRVSALEKLLGDSDMETIVFPQQPSATDLEAAAYFPEAEVLSSIPDFRSPEAADGGPTPSSASASSRD